MGRAGLAEARGGHLRPPSSPMGESSDPDFGVSSAGAAHPGAERWELTDHRRSLVPSAAASSLRGERGSLGPLGAKTAGAPRRGRPNPPPPPSVQGNYLFLATGVRVQCPPPPGTSPRNSRGPSPGKLRNCRTRRAPPPRPAQGGSSGRKTTGTFGTLRIPRIAQTSGRNAGDRPITAVPWSPAPQQVAWGVSAA